MNTIRLNLTSVDTDKFFLSVSDALNTSPVHGTIRIPSNIGTGFISRKVISDDIVFISWDIRLTTDIILTKNPVKTEREDQSFIISYLLSSDELYATNPIEKKKVKIKGNRTILFMSNDAALEFEIPAGETFKLINICVPLRWLRSELSDAIAPFLKFIDRLGEKDHATIFMETSPPAEYRTLMELNAHEPDEERGSLGLKAKIFSLVADFFSRIFDHSAKETPDHKIIHHEKMLEVETLLKQHLETTLPDIATIARRMALSVSTLKRNFKLMFGKSIYEYYLELKMEHARELLVEKNLSVNEVANMLDYEKVSCFIDIFKKHHGHSPGTLRRKSA